MRKTARRLSFLLANLGNSEKYVHDISDRVCLLRAGEIVGDPARLYGIAEPSVVIVNGFNADPVAMAVVDIDEIIDDIRHLLGGVGDSVIELTREVNVPPATDFVRFTSMLTDMGVAHQVQTPGYGWMIPVMLEEKDATDAVAAVVLDPQGTVWYFAAGGVFLKVGTFT